MGDFGSYSSLLYAVNDVVIQSKSEAVNKTTLNSPFPDFYRPTWREVFDTIARQTKSSWKYDAARDSWVFTIPQQPLPFEIQIAKGWKAHDEGFYVGYQPVIAPVGMDVYMLGHYSATNTNEEAELFIRVREAIALRFARSFKKDVSAKEMTEVSMNGLMALHFKVATPSTGIIWRQWIVVHSGLAFAIVSAIKPEHDKDICPDVQNMVESFKVLKGKTGSDGAASGSQPIRSETNRASAAAGPRR